MADETILTSHPQGKGKTSSVEMNKTGHGDTTTSLTPEAFANFSPRLERNGSEGCVGLERDLTPEAFANFSPRLERNGSEGTSAPSAI